jgi:hypothetical protein
VGNLYSWREKGTSGSRKTPASNHLSTFHPSPLSNTGRLLSLKRAEEVITARIRKLCESPANYPSIDLDKAVEWC